MSDNTISDSAAFDSAMPDNAAPDSAAPDSAATDEIRSGSVRSGFVPVILASESPARRKLLLDAGIRPTVQVSRVDEEAALQKRADEYGIDVKDISVSDRVLILASAKAHAVFERRQQFKAAVERAKGKYVVSKPLRDGYGSIDRVESLPEVQKRQSIQTATENGPLIIGCDSLFEFDGRVVGKPHTAQRAEETLKLMKSQRGTLWTGHCIINMADGSEEYELSHAQVVLGDYSDEDIREYVKTGEPLNVAGGFTLDGLGAAFIDSIQGDPSSIIGLSLPTVRSAVEKLAIAWPQLWNAINEGEESPEPRPAVGNEVSSGEEQTAVPARENIEARSGLNRKYPVSVPDTNVRQPGDSWVECDCGRSHWGANHAAGMLIARADENGNATHVLLQHRALWSAEGGKWGIPGGAVASGESVIAGALRETNEEAGVEPDSVDIVGAWCEDHGSWSYTTVFAFEREGFEIIPSAADDESIDVAWVDVNEVSDLPLLSAFARDWPAFAQKLSGLYAENIMAE